MNLNSTGDRIFVILNYCFAISLLIIVLYPIIYIVSASISSPYSLNSGGMWLWPKEINFEGYSRVFQNKNIWIGYRNTVLYTVLGTAVNLAFTIPCAYALSRRDFAGRSIFMFFFVFTMFFNGGLIPTYILVRDFGMLDSIWAMIVPKAAVVFNIIVARAFFQSAVPRELEEAAEIDGCSNFKLFFKIIIPISLPIIAVMALFYGVMHWNSFFDAMIYLRTKSLFPLQLFLREILILNEMGDEMLVEAEAQAEQARISEIIKYAIIIVASLPIILVYPFLQQYFVKGVLIGSLKG